MLKVVNTADPTLRPSVVMLVYGEGGVGKSTFGSTAPKPLLADCEGGCKYFGLRGIKIDVAPIEKWADINDFLSHAKANSYETIVIDPVGELMAKLKRFMIAQNDRKLVQSDGTPSMAGWGWLKEKMRAFLKAARDSGLHVLLIAHVDSIKDEDRIMLWPLLETKLRDEMVNLVDIVGYMAVARDEEGVAKRVIFVDPDSGKFKAKDRTGQLGRIVEPNFSKIVNACQGTETFAWSKAKTADPKAPSEPEAPVEESEARKKMRAAKEKASEKAKDLSGTDDTAADEMRDTV